MNCKARSLKISDKENAERSRSCTQCNKTFAKSSNFKRHMKTHTPDSRLVLSPRPSSNVQLAQCHKKPRVDICRLDFIKLPSKDPQYKAKENIKTDMDPARVKIKVKPDVDLMINANH